MKHVVTAASFRQTVLVTGFGAFPGAPWNPTAAVLARLERHRGRLARLGIGLHCVLLPVVYAQIGPRLEALVQSCRPDAILHLGLASRRRGISIETRALNRAGPLHRDAAKRLPEARSLAAGGAGSLRATYPARQIQAALRRAGHDAGLSIDAGDYVCNAALYASLRARAAPRVGFIHVPRTRRSARPREWDRPSAEDLTDAVLAAVFVLVRGATPRPWRAEG